MPPRNVQLTREGPNPNELFEDRQILVNNAPQLLRTRKGEKTVECVPNVEHARQGEKGTFTVTNLRVMWIANDRRSNHSIGFDCIKNALVHSQKGRVSTQSLVLTTRFRKQHDEKVYTMPSNGDARGFVTLQFLLRSYASTKLYRNLKLRGAIIKDKTLIRLPGEIINNQVDDVWNLSSEVGNPGTFFITSVRVVWHALAAEMYNASIPYIQIKEVTKRTSKQLGDVLIIETAKTAGGFILGFRIQPFERLQAIFQEISGYHTVYSANPNLGVVINQAGSGGTEAKALQASADDHQMIIEHSGFMDTVAAQYADRSHVDADPEYHPGLGLSMEKIRENVTIDMLWNVHTQ